MISLSDMQKLSTYAWALFAMARPTFLLGTLPIYVGGMALAHPGGQNIRISAAICGLALVWVIQSMTHYINEYCDVEADTTKEKLSGVAGGSNILVSGVVPRRTAYITGVILLLLGIVLTLVMIATVKTGIGLLVLAGSAIILGWFYSMPPIEFASRGTGEVVVALTTGILVPSTAYYLQTSTVSTELWLLCLPLFVFGFATSLATALPDMEADRYVGKHTLAVRMGRPRAVGLLVSTIIAGWVLFGYSVLIAGLGITPGTLFAAPLLVGIVVRFAPDAAHKSTGTAEAIAYATVANLGWVSVSASTLLL